MVYLKKGLVLRFMFKSLLKAERKSSARRRGYFFLYTYVIFLLVIVAVVRRVAVWHFVFCGQITVVAVVVVADICSAMWVWVAGIVYESHGVEKAVQRLVGVVS